MVFIYINTKKPIMSCFLGFVGENQNPPLFGVICHDQRSNTPISRAGAADTARNRYDDHFRDPLSSISSVPFRNHIVNERQHGVFTRSHPRS